MVLQKCKTVFGFCPKTFSEYAYFKYAYKVRTIRPIVHNVKMIFKNER